MDSTGPDPQPQLQPPSPQQPQQPQQPLPTQQPKSQPQIHQQPQQAPPQPHHPHQTNQPTAYQPMPQYQHGAYYRGYPPQYPYHPHPSYQFAYPWPQPATNFNPVPAQQLSNMVTPQPQTNVPQQHNKPTAQIISPAVISSASDSPLNTGLQQVNVTNQAANRATVVRERKLATLKDPTTHKEVPLPNTATSSTKPSSSTTKPSSNVTTATTTTASVEHVHKLLQKVSEDNSSVASMNEQQNSQTNKQPVTALLQKVSEDKATKANSPTPITNNAKNMKNDETVMNKKIETAVTTIDKVASKTEVSEIIKAKVEIESVTPAKKEMTTNPAKEASVVKEVVENTKQESDTSSPVVNSSIPDDKMKPGVENGKPKEVEEKKEDKLKDNEEKSIEKVNGDTDGNDSKQGDQEPEDKIVLHYAPGQYNPVSNREGKKIYSREFLFEVYEKVKKANHLLEESNERLGIDGLQLPSAFGDKIDLFAPAYSSRYTPTNRQNEQRPMSQHNYSGRSSAGQDRQRKIINSASLTQEVELKTTSNPWRPAKEVKDDAPIDVVETESLKKKFRSILNKLTPNNFESLTEKVTDLNIDTESKLGEVIDIVFAKALAEPGYCVLYGQMCSHLKKITAGAANFGNTLLRRCQHQFQSDIYSGLNLKERKDKIDLEEDPEVKKQLNEELYEEMYRCRMRGLGLIKFIGELYKIEMLNDIIMFTCVNRLLQDQTSEESLECLCDLLTTIGEKLDMSSQKNAEKEKKAKSASKTTNAYQSGQKSVAAIVASGSSAAQRASDELPTPTTLDQVFEQLHKIRKNKDLSARIRFKLLDTCELREKANWQSKKTKDNNPKKIEEIREAHKEKLEQERRQQNAMGPRRSQEGRRGNLSHSGGSSNQISSLANESNANKGNLHTSASSQQLRDQSIGDNITSNHNDVESQKERQERIKNITFSFLTNQKPKSNISSSEKLAPCISLRPQPFSSSAGAPNAAPTSNNSTSTSEVPDKT